MNDMQSMHFRDVYLSKKQDKAVIAHQACIEVIDKFGFDTEIVSVKINEEDVTERVLEIHKTYHKDKFYEFDSQLPF